MGQRQYQPTVSQCHHVVLALYSRHGPATPSAIASRHASAAPPAVAHRLSPTTSLSLAFHIVPLAEKTVATIGTSEP